MQPRLLLLVFLVAFTLRGDDLGTVKFATSSQNPQAQAAFERGVAALHSFWYDEAADAFRRAQELEPSFAMAYWGEAMTYNHPIWQQQDRDAALKVLARIKEKAPTEREREWLSTLDVLYGNGAKADRDLAYEGALERLAARHPSDDEAKAFQALAILGTLQRNDGDARKQVRAAAILEPLLAKYPDHPGVLHYMIHAYDDPLHAPLGLRAARRYAQVAPAAHHARHMPSHIFLQIGLWSDAASSNEQAYAASVDWVKRRGLPSHKRDLHSLGWLHYIYMQQGRYEEAKKLLDEVAPDRGTSADEMSARTWMLARQVIDAGGSMASVSPAPEVSGHCGSMLHTSSREAATLALGLSAARKGDFGAADAALSQLVSLRNERRGVVEKRIVEIMEAILRATTSHLRGKTDEALTIARSAVELERQIGAPSGPPDTLKPTLEVLGELLLDANRAGEALPLFRESLLRTPNRTASLRGALRAARAVGDADAAREYESALASNLRSADAAVKRAMK